MTDRYLAWMESLANRDRTLVMLFAIAACLVAAWVLVDLLPERVRPWLRTAYLWAGLPLFVITLFAPLLFG